jgi:hypothetical protein
LKVHQTTGRTPALQNRAGGSHSVGLLPEGESLVRNADLP